MGLRLLHVFPSLEVGGSQRRFAAIVNGATEDVTHTVIALDGDLAALELIQSDKKVAVEDVPPSGGSFWSRYKTIKARLEEIRPDALLTYNWGAIEWANAGHGQCHHVHIEDGFGPEEARRQLWRRVLFRRWALRSSQVLVPSSILYALATGVWKLKSQQVHLVPNGIDISRFDQASPVDLSEQLNIPPSELVVGTVAALRKEKNLARAVRAIAEVNKSLPCHLVIVGDGDERAGLEALAEELGLSPRIHFLGHQAHPDQYLKAFDIFLLSSDTEQMPLSVLEAMACRLPLVSTQVGDVKTMVAEVNKSKVTGLSASDLAIALEGLARSETDRHRLGASNYEKVSADYSLEKMIAAHMALYLRRVI